MAVRLLKRYVLPSDMHPFVGRMHDLSIVGMHFDTYEDLSKHPDCKYAFDIDCSLSMLTRRIESLNMVGRTLWPQGMPEDFIKFPVSRYEWLTISTDAFMARYISVVDCTLILISDIFECGLSPQECSIANLKKCGTKSQILKLVKEMKEDQGALRQERNRRFHHGAERSFSSDDQMFHIASLFEHRSGGILDSKGRPLPVHRLCNEALVDLQREFNGVMRRLVKQIDRLYDLLQPEFEHRFSPKFRAGPFARRN